MESVYPASTYNQVDDLCVITTYFNPCGYQSLWNNYLLFRDSLKRSGINLLTMECAFKGAPFQLEAGDNVIQVRANSILWQKERLLNIAINTVRTRFPKLAWIDADVFFENADWARTASRLLDEYPVMQLFERIHQMPKGAEFYNGGGLTYMSFAYDVSTNGVDYVKASRGAHGHTGYAWACRSSLLAHGLYDGMVLSAGDHVMAHSMMGDTTSPCINEIFFTDRANRKYSQLWAEKFQAQSTGAMTFVPGAILHRWHGSNKNRRYYQSLEKLAKFGMDPHVDLCINETGCWEWNSNRPALQNFIAEHFELRREDDDE
jgi:hypothetical protein